MNFLYSLLFLFVSHSYVFATPISINEADLANMIMQDNSLVKSGNYKIESFAAKTGHLKRSFVPKLSVFAGQESFKYVTDEFRNQPHYGAELELNLFNGGKDQLTDEINQVSLQKSKASQKINIFSQLEEARKVFWRAIYLKKLIELYDDSLKLNRKNKTAAIRRIRSGVATKSDQFEFDIKEVELKQDKKRALLGFEVEISRLKILLGIKQAKTLVLKQKMEHDHSWKQLFQHSEEDHNYLILPRQLEVQKTHLKSKLAGKTWYPKVDAHAHWLQRNQRTDFDLPEKKDRQQTVFGIKATWDISQIVVKSSATESAKALEQYHAHKLKFEKEELESELHLELKELELLDGMVHDAEENIKRSKGFFKIITSEYKRGVKTSGDMLMATEKLISSEVRRIKIIKDFHLARAHIMTKLGR